MTASLMSLHRPLTFDMQTSTSDLTVPSSIHKAVFSNHTSSKGTSNNDQSVSESKLAIIGKKLAKRGHTQNSIQVSWHLNSYSKVIKAISKQFPTSSKQQVPNYQWIEFLLIIRNWSLHIWLAISLPYSISAVLVPLSFWHI